jgi:uncharacterized protein (DUF1499 family)
MFRFEDIVLPKSPNTYLVAPPGLCRNATPHAPAPHYKKPASALRDAFLAMVAEEPRVTAGEKDDTLMQYAFVQRSAIMRFPDHIIVRFIAENDGATLAIYSRSKYGYRDMGVNKKRVQDWLEKLARRV